MRLEFQIWEHRRKVQQAHEARMWKDPGYRLRRQMQLDRGRVMSKIFLGVAVLITASYILFP